jgi:phosphoenolpyruvate---glycerone phosphotransferase subunit DhaL
MQTLSIEDVRQALAKVASDVPAYAERLRELDAATGDGDLGITMTIGWNAVREALPTLGQDAPTDIGALLGQAGLAFNRAAASTFGVLLATALMRGGKELRDLSELGLPEVIRGFEAALQGLKERGKAEVGDRTMLDALAPAIEAMKQAQASGQDLPRAMVAAADAAMKGAESTIGKMPKFGRASWIGERAAEVQDAGATAVAYMLRSLAEFVQS